MTNEPADPRSYDDLYLDRDAENDDGGPDLGEILAVLSGGRWWILAFTLLAGAIGYFVAWTTEPRYVADALVQVEKDENRSRAVLGEDVTGMLGRESPVATELQLLRSRKVLGNVVDDLNLTVQAGPLHYPLVGDAIARDYRGPEGTFREPPLELTHYAWGGESIAVSRLNVPKPLLGQQLLVTTGNEGKFSLALANGKPLARDLTVGETVSVNLPEGTIELFIRELQARPGTQFWLRRIHRQQAIGALKSSLSVSEQGGGSAVLKVQVETGNPESAARQVNRVVEAYQRQNVERQSEEAEQTLQFVRSQLPDVRSRLRAAESKLNAFLSEEGSADLTQETNIVLQKSVELEQRQLELKQRKEDLLRIYKENHPQVQTIDRRIASVRNELSTVRSEIEGLPETQQELLRLKRDVEVTTQLYTSLLNTAQELQIARAGTVGNVRIVDEAVVPLGASEPDRKRMIGMALALGAALGLGFVFLRWMLQRSVIEPGQVEKEFGLPTLASVPFSQTERRLRKDRKSAPDKGEDFILASAEPQDVCAESLRSLRTALHFAMLDAEDRVITFTGPSPNLGKSFVTLNFAATLAQAGKRILVIDADMRRGHLHKQLSVPRSPGLSDCISQDAALSDSLHGIGTSNSFYFLSTGTIPPNPSELLMSAQFAELLDQLKQRFDYIVIDTPPALAVTDAAIIGRLSGSTLLLLKEGEHPKPVVRDTLQRLQQAGVSVRGIVFNMVGRTSKRYGSHYGYRYGYTYTYASATK
ncbi:polysaccharide biosynthesis tyrosine autokinase [Algiphilus sp. NNCM1]|uniref:polysaccharide biosynthesis tyrosine autokinase n=1 Tax=Algiphilus sp. TaxID=1872431 RepID=UPI001CA730A4|nr:polysaccharide biosynthesis tyrosine autokinase [Algiphilus sp.]MBY8965060.1 polysaccharide biosynthesis tyrosine autokinase [Algiphilus acroporae]MCI5104213.1 polysaccharide biosynthesis tyrosine autokinase [Algiphilus sp.]